MAKNKDEFWHKKHLEIAEQADVPVEVVDYLRPRILRKDETRTIDGFVSLVESEVSRLSKHIDFLNLVDSGNTSYVTKTEALVAKGVNNYKTRHAEKLKIKSQNIGKQKNDTQTALDKKVELISLIKALKREQLDIILQKVEI